MLIYDPYWFLARPDDASGECPMDFPSDWSCVIAHRPSEGISLQRHGGAFRHNRFFRVRDEAIAFARRLYAARHLRTVVEDVRVIEQRPFELAQCVAHASDQGPTTFAECVLAAALLTVDRQREHAVSLAHRARLRAMRWLDRGEMS